MKPLVTVRLRAIEFIREGALVAVDWKAQTLTPYARVGTGRPEHTDVGRALEDILQGQEGRVEVFTAHG